MSKIALTPNASGTGVFTIASPATSTDRTLTLPDEAGTVLTSASTANFPAGSVLQVVSYLTATQGYQTITTSDSIINSITKVITPLGANSKFLVTVRWFGEINQGWDIPFNIHMDGVRVNIDGQGRGYGLAMAAISYGDINDASTPDTLNISTLVSTSSVVGTAITFSLVADSTVSRTLWNNRCFNIPSGNTEAGTSEMIITEIGG
tara:strand:+ start:1264 stop:1881 length:618 start_codon:yes stop_codon:yes gene_type:complete